MTKTFLFTGKVETWHPGVGFIKPGRNEGPADEVDKLLEAGRSTGEYLPDKHPPKPVEGVATPREATPAKAPDKPKG